MKKKLSLDHSGLQDDLKNIISSIVEINNGYISGRSYLFSLSIFSSLYLMSLIYFGKTCLICSLRKYSRMGLVFMSSLYSNFNFWCMHMCIMCVCVCTSVNINVKVMLGIFFKDNFLVTGYSGSL